MKQREARRKVLIRVRLRGPDGWHDACVMNVSTRGLMLQTARPPGRGSYVELRRAEQVVVGRVIWTRGHRMGLKAQDAMALALLAMPGAAPPASGEPRGERRRVARPPQASAETSRWRARAAQYAWLALLGAGGAGIGFTLVEQALARPLAAVQTVLGAG